MGDTLRSNLDDLASLDILDFKSVAAVLVTAKLASKEIVVVIDFIKTELIVLAGRNVRKVDFDLVFEGGELVLFHRNIITYF